MKKDFYIGIDVGTGSARVGIFDALGKMIIQVKKEIHTWHYDNVFVEQSSDEIWKICCTIVKQSLNQSGISANDIKGIGFDATCSLVALDKNSKPISISISGEKRRNIIVWMDHRASEQAKKINNTHHNVLKYVGKNISPEMETPKLLWIKEKLPDTWKNAKFFFDLPDFLVFQATGRDIRSFCSTVCKWTYLGHLNKWDDSYFQKIGLKDIVDEKYMKIGNVIHPIGVSVGNGLTMQSAKEMGLNPGTPVSVSIIDAHAGGIGMIGAKIDSLIQDNDLTKRLALIAGTSSCHLAISKQPKHIVGVWGPYFSAMLPNMWLTEAGQSATGSLIDHILLSQKQSINLKKQAKQLNISVYTILNNILLNLSQNIHKNCTVSPWLTQNIHVLPYFHGNRSPRANPDLCGAISGLNLSDSLNNLAILYYATIQAIAFGTKHIIESLNSQGFNINTIFACGGLCNNDVFLQEHANITGCQIILPKEREAVLLGSAILAAVAAKRYKTLTDAMSSMSTTGKIISPADNISIKNFYNSKYKIFLKMHDDQILYKNIMNDEKIKI